MFEALMKSQRNPFIKGPHPKNTVPPSREELKRFLGSGRWGWQLKINGRRLQVYIPADLEEKLQFFTRQGTPHTLSVPKEIQDVFRRFYSPESGHNVVEAEWIPQMNKVWIFDILVQDGILLTHLTYPKRHEIISETPFIHPNAQVLPFKKDLAGAIATMDGKEEYIEGIVLKSLICTGFDSHTILRCRKESQ